MPYGKLVNAVLSDDDEAYIRRLDVVNRGFSGFNTTQALRILPQIMPVPEEAKVRFMVSLAIYLVTGNKIDQVR